MQAVDSPGEVPRMMRGHVWSGVSNAAVGGLSPKGFVQQGSNLCKLIRDPSTRISWRYPLFFFFFFFCAFGDVTVWILPSSTINYNVFNSTATAVAATTTKHVRLVLPHEQSRNNVFGYAWQAEKLNLSRFVNLFIPAILHCSAIERAPRQKKSYEATQYSDSSHT